MLLFIFYIYDSYLDFASIYSFDANILCKYFQEDLFNDDEINSSDLWPLQVRTLLSIFTNKGPQRCNSTNEAGLFSAISNNAKNNQTNNWRLIGCTCQSQVGRQ